MLFWIIVKVGLKSLLANKLRSLLAMLGIIIGVAAVISMLGIGAGAKKQIISRIQTMGSNLLVVRPGNSSFDGVVSGTTQNLTLEDAMGLLGDVNDIAMVAPVVERDSQVKFMNKNSRVEVVGTSITYLPIRAFEVEKGRCFTEQEVDRSARVAVLGPKTASDLFGTDDPLGQTIKIKSINFTVVGVLKSKGDQGRFNPDDQVIVPYTTAMQQLFGLDYLREIDIQAKDGADLKTVQDDVTTALRRRHHILGDAAEDFTIRNQADIIQMVSESSQTFTVLLGGIASISLVVGGIGIMNIMLVTVTERTREIGIRMAIGAKRKNIRLQFLLESSIISCLGGLFGVILGVATASLISSFSRQFSSEVEPTSILLSLTFSIAVGVLFGWYPAHRASSLDPIEALRYE
jgi:putative ABC transport system permease protein